jgi:hypothetical protein
MKKQTWENLAHFVLGVIFTLVFMFLLNFNWERRFVLYHIRNELKLEMPRGEVERIIENHKTPFLIRQDFEDHINLRVNLDIGGSYTLGIFFNEGKLKFAGIRNGDGGDNSPHDAPPDLK